ncbi:uncharacterized protein LOC124775607 [Schistocerca piceifrons]|uniref:uncharacterized protein LOC124775607 n=1 Tax=Schistocerca piceifrons TaxID=274613 RepID=UPI001F5E94A5|nr:uncharacterized protein LOC124775607 [Schistocerca piceifrons]
MSTSVQVLRYATADPCDRTRVLQSRLPLTLLRLRALPADGSAAARFRANSSLPSWLQLDSNSGRLYLVAAPQFATPGNTEVVVTVTAMEDGVGDAEVDAPPPPWAVATVRLVAAGSGACNVPPQEACLWRQATLRVLENLPAGAPLGTLGPPPLCARLGTGRCHRVYAGLNASLDGVSVSPSPPALGGALEALTSRPLDREDPQLEQPQWRRMAAAGAAMSLEVLDADDSAPATINDGHLYSSRPGGLLHKGELLGTVVLQDADSPAVNRYSWRFLNDSRGLLAANCSSSAINGTFVTTIISCSVFAARDEQLAGGDYRTVLRLLDAANPDVYADSEVRVRAEGPQAAAQRVPAPAVSYPAEAAVLAGANAYARLAQPANLRQLAAAPRLAFRLAAVSPQPPDGDSSPFGVTRVAGIIFLKNPDKLDPNTTVYNVTVTWGSEGRATVRVYVLEGASEACQNGSRQGRPCATRKSLAECNAFCGLGTGARNYTVNHLHEGRNSTARPEVAPLGGCAWRGAEANFSTDLIAHYATCTPDVRHCPDGFCDPLEQISALCPQDCVNLTFGTGKLGMGRRGLYSCVGVGVCNRAACWCHTRAGRDEPGAAIKSGHRSLVAESPVALVSASGSRASCGAVCVMAVVAGSALLLSAAVATLYWRYRLCRRAQCERKLAAAGAAAASASDYVQRAHCLLPHDARPPVDPQWEFPRSRLLLEKTLGEGEFGRVLRARAIDIAGVTGATTVAVKTLKEGAGASEQQALLSEYELLKAVSHPHVVRLLGACTSPAGPLYLIIEFAEHGSLRNYLRKIRHLELRSAPVSRITPRDILNFAWQIAKGMAYLSDMKLVHRDLAARNVLVASGGVCKISDFGLTRDVYEDDAYLKKSKGRVPVKWMAPESLSDHVYTSKSDVWGFGVLLWELVTLGASPYPGVALHKLFSLLRAGYRMERPNSCSPALYKVMRRCWLEEPSDRPSFKELTYTFEKMLEDSVEYLNLDALVVQNYAYFNSTTLSQDKLSTDGLEHGTMMTVPLDVIKDIMPPSDSWQQTEFHEGLLPSLTEKQEESSLFSTVGNSYLSPVRIVKSKARLSPYMNMVGRSEAEKSKSDAGKSAVSYAAVSEASSPSSSNMTTL